MYYGLITSYSRTHPEPFFHPVGSAAMAPQNIGGVVSPQLKVYGIKNVRVADASVIPFTMATHPSQTIYAVGEKVRHFYWHLHYQSAS